MWPRCRLVYVTNCLFFFLSKKVVIVWCDDHPSGCRTTAAIVPIYHQLPDKMTLSLYFSNEAPGRGEDGWISQLIAAAQKAASSHMNLSVTGIWSSLMLMLRRTVSFFLSHLTSTCSLGIYIYQFFFNPLVSMPFYQQRLDGRRSTLYVLCRLQHWMDVV